MKLDEEVIWHKIKKIILKQLRKGKRSFRIISEDNTKEYEASRLRERRRKALSKIVIPGKKAK